MTGKQTSKVADRATLSLPGYGRSSGSSGWTLLNLRLATLQDSLSEVLKFTPQGFFSFLPPLAFLSSFPHSSLSCLPFSSLSLSLLFFSPSLFFDPPGLPSLRLGRPIQRTRKWFGHPIYGRHGIRPATFFSFWPHLMVNPPSHEDVASQ